MSIQQKDRLHLCQCRYPHTGTRYHGPPSSGRKGAECCIHCEYSFLSVQRTHLTSPQHDEHVLVVVRFTSPLQVTSRTISFASSGETVHPTVLSLCALVCAPLHARIAVLILTHILQAVCHSPRKQAQRCHTSTRGLGAKFPYPSRMKRRPSKLLLAPQCSLRLLTSYNGLVSQSVCVHHPFSSHY